MKILYSGSVVESSLNTADNDVAFSNVCEYTMVSIPTHDPLNPMNNNNIMWIIRKHLLILYLLPHLLALGKIVVASKTGGNRYFDKMGVEGVLLYDTKEEAIKQLSRVKNMTIEERNVLGAKNKDFFDKYLSSRVMYDNYIELIRSFQDRNKHSI